MKLDLFPLNTVLFPGGELRLKVFEQRYLELTKRAIADGAPFGIVALTGGGEVGREQAFAEVGTSVRVAHWDMPQTGIFSINVQATARFKVASYVTNSTGLHVAEVEPIVAEPVVEIGAEHRDLSRLLEGLIAKVGEDRFGKPIQLLDASYVGARLCEVMPLPLNFKQRLLEISDAALRLDVLKKLLLQQGVLTA